MRAFSQNIIFFYTPTVILSQSKEGEVVRVGGKVKHGSINKISPNENKFIITDNTSELQVYFKGILPPLFKEGQEVVAKGYMNQKLFIADDLLAKHDERYMPPESE
ncbi:cytochrome c maturation protein CcmE [Orientia tsutsugamushi]|uniref:cytochrome c maturation protein CcmE n=1 Tax=Orientia tsutsugamushi TaxID=784 RepID=UPI003528BA50